MAKKLTRQALIELPADEVTLNRLADEIMKKTSAQGYLTVSNALQDTAQEYGDFQTPLPLAKFACQRLVQMGYRPKILIEPTCGEGNFIIAALEAFPSIRKVFGLEIQEGCVAKCKARLLATLWSRAGLKREIHIKQGNIFTEPLTPGVLKISEDDVLVLGNPPWVTNTALSALESTNLPAKSNFKGHSGLDAMTGKSSFEIAEFIILQLT